MNNLYQQLSRQQQNPLQQLINNFKNSKNPEEFLRNYIQSNPKTQDVYSMLQNSNKSPKQLFYILAQQKGIDPNQILNMLK